MIPIIIIIIITGRQAGRHATTIALVLLILPGVRGNVSRIYVHGELFTLLLVHADSPVGGRDPAAITVMTVITHLLDWIGLDVEVVVVGIGCETSLPMLLSAQQPISGSAMGE